jgi:hypothetical protein
LVPSSVFVGKLKKKKNHQVDKNEKIWIKGLNWTIKIKERDVKLRFVFLCWLRFVTVASCVPVTQHPHITALLSYVRIVILITLLLNIKDFSQLVTLRIWHKVAKQWKPLVIY